MCEGTLSVTTVWAPVEKHHVVRAEDKDGGVPSHELVPTQSASQKVSLVGTNQQSVNGARAAQASRANSFPVSRAVEVKLVVPYAQQKAMDAP